MAGVFKIGGKTVATHDESTDVVSLASDVDLSNVDISNNDFSNVDMSNMTFPAGHVVQTAFTKNSGLYQSSDLSTSGSNITYNPNHTGIIATLSKPITPGSIIYVQYTHSGGNGDLSRSGDSRIKSMYSLDKSSWYSLDCVVWPGGRSSVMSFIYDTTNTEGLLNSSFVAGMNDGVSLFTAGMGTQHYGSNGSVVIAKHYSQWTFTMMEIMR